MSNFNGRTRLEPAQGKRPIDGPRHLVAKNGLLADFKAVQSGDAWCTTQNMFQETMSLGDMIVDFHSVIADEWEEVAPTYLYRLW